MREEHTLVTFLHTAFVDRCKPQEPAIFREAHYAFEGGNSITDRLFGFALCSYLNSTPSPPTRLVVLGTPGSSWGRFIAYLAPSATASELAELDLKSTASDISTADLEPWLSVARDAVRARFGRPDLMLELVTTGYATNADEQRGLIELIAPYLEPGGRLTIDVTHGLRHLSLLGVFSAMALQRLRGVAIRGIYYGALDRTANGKTPVWQLDGLVQIADWLAALRAFDKDGDYGIFAPLLEAAGVPRPVAGNLADAAFAEMIGNYDEAVNRLETFREKFETASIGGAAQLFRSELLSCVSWTGAGLYVRQRRMAYGALDRGDVVRACLNGFEAFVTLLAYSLQLPELNKRDRERARDDYFTSRAFDGRRNAAERLRVMRNRIAHTDFTHGIDNDVDRDVVRLMEKRDTCTNALRLYLDQLLPETLTDPTHRHR
jgi:CRISPR-associated Csx2 family protein